MSQIQVRPMENGDLPAVVSLHLKAFRGFFLSFLGPEFLRILYQSILADESGIAFAAFNEKGLAGFIAGTTQPNGFYRRLAKQRWWKFGWASAGALLRNPKILPRLVRAFAKPNQEPPADHCGTLMSIAVDPDEQGHGIGKLLVKAFLDESARRGIAFVNLTTDTRENEATNRFYQSLNFYLHHTYVTPEGRWMNEYLIQLDQQTNHAAN